MSAPAGDPGSRDKTVSEERTLRMPFPSGAQGTRASSPQTDMHRPVCRSRVVIDRVGPSTSQVCSVPAEETRVPLRRDGALTSEVRQTLPGTGRSPENTLTWELKTRGPPWDTDTVGMWAHPQAAAATRLTGDKPVTSAAMGPDGLSKGQGVSWFSWSTQFTSDSRFHQQLQYSNSLSEHLSDKAREPPVP